MSISYYEKVVVVSSNRFPGYTGRTGVVLGISKDDCRVYSYSVFFEGEDEGITFLPEELEGTRQFVDRSEFYDNNDRIRIRVLGDEGSLSE